MVKRNLDKIEWPLVLDRLSESAQTPAGKTQALALTPSLSQAQIMERWELVRPLVDLIRHGQVLNIGPVDSVAAVITAARKDHILEGAQFHSVLALLAATARVHAFAGEFASICATLRKFRPDLQPLPLLVRRIDRCIDPEGGVRDDASPELAKLRAQKRNARKSIEDKLRHILKQEDMEKYLQDDYFTIRSDRYVIPLSVDSRGRIPGAILGTSSSGQTLFVEPTALAPLNQTLLETEVSEKAEILRILRELTAEVAQNSHAIAQNYDRLVELDFLHAQASLGYQLRANEVEICAEPVLHLIQARHPFVTTPNGAPAVPNDIILNEGQKTLIISGPNAGGKTVILKTVGLLQLMLKSGLLIPAEHTSKMFLFENLFIELGDAQDLVAHLSTFSGHIRGLKPILDRASAKDLVLLDELAVGTEPQTGAAIAQAILEHLAHRRTTALVSTHFDNLKSLAYGDDRFRNGSMLNADEGIHPTFKLALDVPGRSFGLEVAEREGLPLTVTARVRELRGNAISAFDQAIERLRSAAEDVEAEKKALRAEVAANQAEKIRWQQEVELIKQTRREAAEKLVARFEKSLEVLSTDFETVNDELRRLKQRIGADDESSLLAGKQRGKALMKEYREQVNELGKHLVSEKEKPGRAFAFEELSVGSRVFVSSLDKEGRIVHLGSSPNDKVEVEVGNLKVKLPLDGLRLLSKEAGRPMLQANQKKRAPSAAPKKVYALQNSTNSVDVRGLSVDDALQKMWKFIDGALLRGESAVFVVHGHGTASLKNHLRAALENESPYPLSFAAADRDQGGDGVTIIYF